MTDPCTLFAHRRGHNTANRCWGSARFRAYGPDLLCITRVESRPDQEHRVFVISADAAAAVSLSLNLSVTLFAGVFVHVCVELAISGNGSMMYISVVFFGCVNARLDLGGPLFLFGTFISISNGLCAAYTVVSISDFSLHLCDPHFNIRKAL